MVDLVARTFAGETSEGADFIPARVREMLVFAALFVAWNATERVSELRCGSSKIIGGSM
jgi:hypothetical protein